MKLIEIEDGKRMVYNKVIAQSWNELTGNQLAKIQEYFYENRHQLFETQEDSDQLKIKDPVLFEQVKNSLLMTLLDISYEKYMKLPEEATYTLMNESEALKFLFSENSRTRPAFRKVNIKGPMKPKYFYGPAEMLKGISFEEFIFLDKYFIAYIESEDLDHLSAFCSLLYRPIRKNLNVKDPEWNGDMRERFNATLASSRIELWTKQPVGIKKAIFQYYDGCRRQLKTICPHLFETVEVEEMHDPTDWVEVLHSQAGGKFGTFNETKEAFCIEVLKDMDFSIKNHNKNNPENE